MASFYVPWFFRAVNGLQSLGTVRDPTTSASTLGGELPKESRVATSINAVPYELWFMIYGYLSTRDLKAVSSCSKAHHERAIPLVYAHIRLSETSIKGFESGAYKHRRALVREVTFEDLQEGWSVHETGYISPSQLQPITNAESRVQLFKRYLHTLLIRTFANYVLKQFLGDNQHYTFAMSKDGDYFPRTLEVASGHSFDHSLFRKPFKNSFTRNFYYPWTFYFASASTLKSLTLKMKREFGRHDPPVVFPRVRFLHMSVRYGINSKMIDIISEMCPAVEHLYLGGRHAGTDRSERLGLTLVYYLPIRKFEYLQTARIPWPYKSDPNIRHGSKWVAGVMLCHNVRHWTGFMSNTFYMNDLRRVDFAKAGGQHETLSYDTPLLADLEEGEVTEVLRVQKEEDGNWAPDHTFGRENPEYLEPYWDYRCH
ncbi:uncharacterized protein DFL_000055 [Arthrobotrys flagrans]|uniref:F-box domain-containing protein n=1 Tax=Arthrobotrys flagrans TaxID=97331 RepID=A0A437AD42_ARTFL|nr:hypothetical protein DFL_000055 [Arthrobotrys flagrans]